MQWVQIKDQNIITAPGGLPEDIPEEDAIQNGWLPVIDLNERPSSDQLADEELIIKENHVERTWINIRPRPELITKQNLETLLDLSLESIEVFNKIENPSDSEILEITKILSESIAALIRLQRNIFT